MMETIRCKITPCRLITLIRKHAFFYCWEVWVQRSWNFLEHSCPFHVYVYLIICISSYLKFESVFRVTELRVTIRVGVRVTSRVKTQSYLELQLELRQVKSYVKNLWDLFIRLYLPCPVYSIHEAFTSSFIDIASGASC